MTTPAGRHPTPRPLQTGPARQFDPIDPRWLLKAVAWTLLAALICGYLTLCLLFYQGQWQLILHPQRNTAPLTTLAGFPAQPIRFDAAETGTPRLSGALLPAAPAARYAAYTVLYLRAGESSLAQDPTDARNLAILHTLGVNIFAFDYRGSGESEPTHPTQVRMTEDAQAAFRYLHETRGVPETRILPFGLGVAASLAAEIAIANPATPAVLLAPPAASPLSIVLADPRVQLLPIRALFHEEFSLNTLSTLTKAKLLIVDSTAQAQLPPVASPKFTLNVAPSDSTSLATGISRFLDEIIDHRPAAVKE